LPGGRIAIALQPGLGFHCAMLSVLVRAAVCLALATPAVADLRLLTFTPSDADFPNPERGWWVFAADDFAKAGEEDFAGLAAEGLTVAYGIVRLDDYRETGLPPELLADLDQRFAWSRDHGVKIILRFAYNYPDTAFDYETAKDAPLPIVLQHIDQLAPVIAANADTVLAFQAGFIGAWGEWHTSSNSLDRWEARVTIGEALFRSVPKPIPIQFRYPPDALSWHGDRKPGVHNDCFLSSPTDVGTYSEDPAQRRNERAEVAERSDNTFFSGETCDAEADLARYGCDAVLAEGAAFHLSALGRDYYEAFHQNWRAEGCYAEVALRLGYRLRLVELEIGDTGDLRLRLANDGWARPVQARPLLVTAYAGGQATGQARFAGTLDRIGGGETVEMTAKLPPLVSADRLCLSAPDQSPRLAANPSFAIRFANANGKTGGWDAELAAFCIDLD
jgi:hypothetical protein